MSKALNVALLVFIGAAFFMLKDELDNLKQTINTINQAAAKIEQLEKKLNNLNITFQEELEKNEKFKESTVKFMYNTLKRAE